MVDTAPLLTPEQVLRRMEWKVLKHLDGRLQGDFHTLLRGQGTDFRDLRDYEWGDDVRHIDWNVTARMDQLFVREFLEDRDVTAWLLLDRTRSMAFGPLERTKEQVLRELGTTFAQLLVRSSNRVGAIFYDGHELWTLPPRQGRHQVLTLVDHLMRPVDGGATTDLSMLLERADRVIRRRSLIVLISDFISEPGWDRPLLRLTERHEVVAVRLVDPREYELPDAGWLFVQDAETGEQLLVDTSNAQFRDRLRAAAVEQEAAIRRGATSARAQLHLVSTEDDLVGAFVRMAERAKRYRR